MNISERYRQLVGDAQALLEQLPAEEGGGVSRFASQGVLGLRELEERVGDIPRIRLEAELTPVLLKAHGNFDRARLLLEEGGEGDRAAAVWEMEQKIYRLLNEL